MRKANQFRAVTNRLDDADARSVRAVIGKQLQEMYSGLLREGIPPKIAELLRCLDTERLLGN